MAESELISRWQRLHDEVDECSAQMLAVSKYHSDEEIRTVASCGQRDFAESRPQSLRDRAQTFPELNWHMIGPVQKNKAKYVGRFASMWHSLSSFEVAEEVVKHVSGRVLPVLLQINISGEAQKYGVDPEQAAALLEKVRQLNSLKVIGLMGMAAKCNDDGSGDESDAARASFVRLRNLRDQLADASLRELCMGMSGDYRIAIEEGATMVRLGTVLFGARSQLD